MTPSSDRERRLWLWASASVVAIYSTLGVARPVSDALRDRNLLRIVLVALVVVVVGLPAWRWVKGRPGWADVGAVLGVAFAYWMVWVRTTGWEERTHLMEYGVVAALIHMALLERRSNGVEVVLPAGLTVAATTLLGLLDEIVQAVLPGRFFDIRDVFFNFVAAFMVVAARLALAPQARPGWRIWFLWLWATAVGWGWGVYWGWYTDDEPKTLEAIPESLTAGYLGLATGAGLISVLQWLVLRHHLTSALRWIPVTVAAVPAVGIMMVGVGALDADLGWLAGVSSFGTIAGLLQWTLLRSRVPRAGWWILASTIGWAAGMPFGDLNGPLGLGAVYGAVTATALVGILRQRRAPVARPTPV